MGEPPRIFSPDALQKHVDKALGLIPTGCTRAILAYAKTDGTVCLAFAYAPNAHWTLGAVVSHAPHEGWTGEVAFKGTW
jgi:hypothetical protein